MGEPNGSRPARLLPVWGVVVGAILCAVAAACGGSPSAGPPSGLRAPSPGSTPQPVKERCSTEYASASDITAATLTLRTDDGVSLYGAEIGSGGKGVVLANDVPHPFCQDIPPAVLLAHRGYHVMVFDYRGHGSSAPSASAPGRLDLDVAAATAILRQRGATHVAVLGSYAGAAACIVAAVRITPPVDAIVGFSPAAQRGQYVGGPFEPEGALDAAPKLRTPALYATATDDRFVPLVEARKLYATTASHDKQLVTVAQGPGGWYLLQYNDKVRRAVLRFLAANL